MATVIKKRLLVAPLDWGWGHLYRSLTLCREWPQPNWEFYILAPAPLVPLLQKQYPNMHFIPEQPLGMHYPKNRFSLWYWLKTPIWLTRLISDKLLCAKLVKNYNPDLILSDSRPWFSSTKKSSIILIHQLHPLIPKFPRLQKLCHIFLHSLLQKFKRIWVPDYEGEEASLAGILSHPASKNCSYIGPISRFKKWDLTPTDAPQKLLFLLTGPEAHRKDFFNKLALAFSPQYSHWQWHICGIKGTNHSQRTFHPFPSEVLLEELLNHSNLIVSRTGYTTLMDLAHLQLNALLIPTPGQSEQEFLGHYIRNRFIVYQEPDLQNPIPHFTKLTFPKATFPPSQTLPSILEQELNAIQF